MTDLRTGKATRFNIGKGIAAFRGFDLSARLAVFNVLRPVADGDLLRLLDVNPALPRYLQFFGDVTLPHLTAGPEADVNPNGTQRRTVSVTPDGRYAFVTFGGEGKIAMVDTITLRSTTVSVPTALNTTRQRGGVVNAFQLGVPSTDLAGRRAGPRAGDDRTIRHDVAPSAQPEVIRGDAVWALWWDCSEAVSHDLARASIQYG